MIKKVIALIFVSFFIVSGLTVLTENNQNYNIFENNNLINNFIVPSSKSIVNLSYVSDFNLSNLYSGLNSLTSTGYGYSGANQYSASYKSNLYYLGYYNSNYYVYDYSLISNSISQFIKLNFTPQNLGIYSGELYVSQANSGNVLTENLNTNVVKYYYEVNGQDYTDFSDSFYNGTIIAYSTGGGYLTIWNTTNGVQIESYAISGANGNTRGTWENGNYFYTTIVVSSSSCEYIWGLNLNDFSQSPIGVQPATNYPIFSYNNYSYLPTVYDGSNFITSSKEISFTTNSSIYLPFTTSATDYNNFSFSPYNFYASSLGNKSMNFYPHFINGYIDNTFLYSTLNNQKYYMSLPFNFSSSNTYFLAQGKSYLYMINPYNNMVYIFRNPVGSLYYLTVKSYNSLSSQINNYLLFNGQLTTTSISISNSYPCLPTIIPLNYSTYYYNGPKIIITSSDYTGSFNKYYNLSIYYNQIQAPSIPLYNIFTYMYPISIIGLFVGMGAFVFAIKKRGYKI